MKATENDHDAVVALLLQHHAQVDLQNEVRLLLLLDTVVTLSGLCHPFGTERTYRADVGVGIESLRSGADAAKACVEGGDRDPGQLYIPRRLARVCVGWRDSIDDRPRDWPCINDA